MTAKTFNIELTEEEAGQLISVFYAAKTGIKNLGEAEAAQAAVFKMIEAMAASK